MKFILYASRHTKVPTVVRLLNGFILFMGIKIVHNVMARARLYEIDCFIVVRISLEEENDYRIAICLIGNIGFSYVQLETVTAAVVSFLNDFFV